MDRTGQRIAALMLFTFMTQMALGCTEVYTTGPQASPLPVYRTPAPVMIESPNPAAAFAQATIDAGQSQLADLDRRATEVSLNMSQAAKAAALSTQDYNQRQKMELAFQATSVSLNITQAAATQKSIGQQTKVARDATAGAQSKAATVAQSAYLSMLNQTEQAQAILDDRTAQTAQAAAALAAYPLTATPFALTQSALLMQQYDREQQAFVDRVVVPLIPIVAVLDMLLIVAGIIWAYRQYMLKPRQIPWPRRLGVGQVNVYPRPLIMIDGIEPRLHRVAPFELTPANPPRLPGENIARVEIINATEPPVAQWLAEIEHQLETRGGL